MAWKNISTARSIGAAGTVLAGFAMSAGASAQVLPAAFVLPAATSVFTHTSCGQTAASAPGGQGKPFQTISKAATISGGISKLEQMRLAQLGTVTEPVVAAAPTAATPVVETPVAIVAASQASICASLGIKSSKANLVIAAPIRTGDILDSRRIKIGKTSFDKDWNRVRNSGISQRQARRFAGRRQSDRLETLAQVNRTVNRKIAFVDDSARGRPADHWASAGSTLRKREGDCEDIAIAKMQILAALGFDRSKMTLTIAKDLVRGRDHSILIVEHEGKTYLLDNESDVLLDGLAANDYRPIFSYSGSDKWIHGYSVG